MHKPFYLVTETSFHASYLVNAWSSTFESHPLFQGIVVREEKQSADFDAQREKFHQQFQGCHTLADEALKQLSRVYSPVSETDLAMIKLFGVPVHSVTSGAKTVFLGKDLNSKHAWQWLSEVSTPEPPYLFIFLDQLLQSWWIELTHAQIINGHSAVLPFARGMYAIENIAISQDGRSFAHAAGATTHYIDAGIDTGPIIKVHSLANPFSFDSIWELKAASFQQVFGLLIATAQEYLESPGRLMGFSPEIDMRGPNFNRRSFTDEARKKAAQGYLGMKAAAMIQSR